MIIWIAIYLGRDRLAGLITCLLWTLLSIQVILTISIHLVWIPIVVISGICITSDESVPTDPTD